MAKSVSKRVVLDPQLFEPPVLPAESSEVSGDSSTNSSEDKSDSPFEDDYWTFLDDVY